MLLEILVVIAVLAVVGFGLAYFLRGKTKKSDEYVWVGPGQDPFKQKDEEEEEEYLTLDCELENEEEE